MRLNRNGHGMQGLAELAMIMIALAPVFWPLFFLRDGDPAWWTALCVIGQIAWLYLIFCGLRGLWRAFVQWAGGKKP
ncbi:MAG TPA: hypothetical protein PKO06_08715 [Candidatus Ozemobacteraceae bacterium]|nr:hypothetical protein [Candidatus Ozemobacteraceae bacterium]